MERMPVFDLSSGEGRRGRACDMARSAARGAAGWVTRSPGTHVWLVVLAITSGVIATASPGVRNFLLHHNSTNLAQLRMHPVRVLVASALWTETPSGFVVYAVLYELIHAPAERWMGTRWWLITVGIAHVGATLVSQQAVLLGIEYERLPRSMSHTVDIGVSYGLVGVLGVLSYAIRRPWRWGYIAAVVGFLGWSVVAGRTFTDLGHFTALLLGLGCYAATPTARRVDRGPGGGPRGSGSGPARPERRAAARKARPPGIARGGGGLRRSVHAPASAPADGVLHGTCAAADLRLRGQRPAP